MDKLESGPLPSPTPAKGENLIFRIAVAIFWGLSACFLGSILWGSQQNLSVRLRISLAILSFVFGFICFSASPANQGRTLRDLTRMLGASPKVEDLVQLQRNVGSAGFFNRIGLVGIPLTVAGLALLFCGCAFLAQKLGFTDGMYAFLDLTKLSVGAFIGALTRSKKQRSET